MSELKPLESYFENTRVLSNGQIRSECPFSENHVGGSGKYSFFVSPEINAYHCFSCGEHGRLTNLLQRRFGVSVFDSLTYATISFDTEKRVKEFELDINWEVKPVKDFLERGFSEKTQNLFKIGKHGEWIVIPFLYNGNLKGYQLRINKPDRVVLNSTGFNKKEFLYNHDTSFDEVIVVEGYSDVWRLYQFGYHAEAILGATVSDWQAEQLRKFRKVYLAFDHDKAGVRATELCYSLIKDHTEVLLIPYDASDPGDCTKRKWEKAFSEPTSYAEYSYHMALELDYYTELKNKINNVSKYDYKSKGVPAKTRW